MDLAVDDWNKYGTLDNLRLDIRELTIIEAILFTRPVEPDQENIPFDVNKITIKTLCIDSSHDHYATLDEENCITLGDMTRLLNILTKYKVQTLKLENLNVSPLMLSVDKKPYTHSNLIWTVKKITIENCYGNTEHHYRNFLFHLFDDSADGILGISSICVNNYIEEIRLIGKSSNSRIEYGCKTTIKFLLGKNYRIRVLKIYNGKRQERLHTARGRQELIELKYEDIKSKEVDQELKLLLIRNNEGYIKCKSAVYEILAIKRFRNDDSLFRYLNKDIVRMICDLVLSSIGTKIWCD